MPKVSEDYEESDDYNMDSGSLSETMKLVHLEGSFNVFVVSNPVDV
jgi:hypothetical protein